MSKFLSYGRQYIDKTDINSVTKILRSDYLTQGPTTKEFEKEICKFTGAKYCVAVVNGTAALHLAVLSLGIKKNKEGITTPITFSASSNALLHCGLRPKFADIDHDTYNININEIKKKITKNTKVIVAVDYAGQPADMKKIYKLAKSKGIYVIEDASHAIGSKYDKKTMVGSCKFSDLTTFSFHPVKTITCGEGGAIATNNRKLYEKIKILRNHGITKNPKYLKKNPGPWYYEMQLLGFNYRLSDIHAALGISQMKKIHRFIKRRREIVKKYNHAFKNLPHIKIPFEKRGVFSVFHLYILQIDFKKIGKTRKKVMEELKKNRIGTQVHYIPVHTQPFYKNNFNFKYGDYPVAENYYQKTLSLPLYPKMTNKEVEYVINTVKKIL
jgi:UDP-4-amino-4,6-dideoxy-N-acetyl-beta-L-altrosamine transaminase